MSSFTFKNNAVSKLLEHRSILDISYITYFPEWFLIFVIVSWASVFKSETKYNGLQ